MAITILINNKKDIQLLYSARNFVTGLIVTGYFIYPDFQKSDVFTFDELGDGIYSVEIVHNRRTDSNTEKYGIVVKENGVVKKFEIILIQN